MQSFTSYFWYQLYIFLLLDTVGQQFKQISTKSNLIFQVQREICNYPVEFCRFKKK